MNSSKASRSSHVVRLACAGALLGAAGCPEPHLEGVEHMPVGGHGHTGVSLVIDGPVDVLFVIDNSASMGEEQAALAAGFDAFVEVLSRPGVEADYRIGVTTTDNGNPWCASTTPEAGALQLSSCRERLEDFVFEGAETIDAGALACTNACPEQWERIDITPTEIPGYDGARPRPWIQGPREQSNLPEGLSLAQAFRCLAPQGIAGCGFESPLESMWKALRRAQTQGEEEFGFVRDDAILSVIFVTDEADCSTNTEWETIFLPDGDRVFWSDPDAAAPTSAVCWNAGVACEGEGVYDDCWPIDLDVEGQEVPREDADDLAVLRPVSRYVQQLEDFEDIKQRISPDQEVLVSVIAGVGADGVPVYQDVDAEPEFLGDFGIGPGCSSASGSAVPPVRLRALADAFTVAGERNMYSACEWNYAPALEAAAEAIAGQIRPACYPACVADQDPDTATLEPGCTVTMEWPRADGSFEERVLRECEGDAVPEGEDTCYQMLVGDERAEFCAEIGFNLEFRVVHREGVLAPEQANYLADCDLSEDKATDCPELP